MEQPNATLLAYHGMQGLETAAQREAIRCAVLEMCIPAQP
jgi:hypothetical protein